MTDPVEKTEDKGESHELFAKATERTNDLLAELIEQNKIERTRRDAPKQAEKPAPLVYTQEQLQAAVDEGKITVGQMVEYVSEVKAAKQAEKLRQDFKVELASERQRGTVETKLAAYRASYPDLNDKGSDLRKEVVEAFQELVADGANAEDLRTELLACQTVMGRNPEKKKAEKPKERTAERQRSVETTGGRSERGKAAADPSGGPSWMPDDLRPLYEKRIAQGMYKSWEDETLKKELGFLKRNIDRKKSAA